MLSLRRCQIVTFCFGLTNAVLLCLMLFGNGAETANDLFSLIISIVYFVLFLLSSACLVLNLILKKAFLYFINRALTLLSMLLITVFALIACIAPTVNVEPSFIILFIIFSIVSIHLEVLFIILGAIAEKKKIEEI